MLLSVAVLALLASAQGRAVNISNTWVLPEEGFPVFYRYFRDRISWYEADAVCQFHHANLVTVDTTAQYDAVRAYLKELDISSAVWVGLIRSNPDGDFTWTDYRGLSGDGYWSSAPDTQSAPLCAAADPAADYRWEARACGGPTVASFICELPVPQWALGNEGCMIRALPALTILYLPESAAVQLTADCGMAGVKKVQCTGNVEREELLKELSCDEDELSSSLAPSTSSNLPISTDSTFTDQDTTNEVTTEDTITTEHATDVSQHHIISITSLPQFIYPQTQYKTPTKLNNFNKFNSVLLSKNINLSENLENNLHGNFIPKIAGDDNVLNNDQLEKLEDERHMQHKMLHEEIARVGNVENIFTQPTDHFIPPLVMAKAKISDDMTVLSLAEKHAQQLAEKHFGKQNSYNPATDHSYLDIHRTPIKSTVEDANKPYIEAIKLTKYKNSKKEALKSNLPKKYMNEKHYDVKNKISKNTDVKVAEKEIPTETTYVTESNTIEIESTTTQKASSKVSNKKNNKDDVDVMDLTVLLKDSPVSSLEQTSFSGDVAKLETIQNITLMNHTEPETHRLDISMNKQVNFVTTPNTKTVENMTLEHEVIKITIIADDDLHNTSVFEITTKMPVFRDSLTTTPVATTHTEENITDNTTTANYETTTIYTTKTISSESTAVPVTYSTNAISTVSVTDNITTTQPTTAQPVFTSTQMPTSSDITTTTDLQNKLNSTEDVHEVKIVSSMSPPTTTANVMNHTKLNVSNESVEKNDEFNNSEYHEILMNMTDHRHGEDEDMTDSDFQSPLLSGVMEPMHRPPRTRRPQQPNRNKFNPFRILG